MTDSLTDNLKSRDARASKNYLSPQSDIESGKFLEHGEFKGNLYGTSTDGIRELIGAGYQPILTPHFQVVVMMMPIMMFFDRNDDSGRDALESRSRSEISKTIDEEKAQALKMLRNPELKPFIIYVRPPPFDVLKETRHQVIVDIGADINNNIVSVLVFKIMP